MVAGRYRIGDVLIRINAPSDLPCPENLRLFKEGIGQTEYSENWDREADCAQEIYACVYTVRIAYEIETLIEELKKRQTGRSFEREDLTVFETDAGECRFLNFKGADWHYAISNQTGEKSCDIWFSVDALSCLTLDTVFWSAFCLERLMIGRKAVVLHCAYIEWNGAAILFSAPSGTGKSTQADLWKRYRGTRTLNGDRSLLMKKGGRWYACGWPICGSSKICVNKSYPIKAIIMLRQAKCNTVRTLHGIEAVREVLPQLMINSWNGVFQFEAMAFLDELLGEIPVYMLACDISEQAVNCLEEYLKRTDGRKT